MKRRRGPKWVISQAIAIFALFFLMAVPIHAGDTRPRLILQLSVDQLRGDLPGRYRDRLGEGGFRYLFEQGTWYINAHYKHANTETAVGHATLATGADPSRHGIVANDWIDQKTGALVYNTEDNRHRIVGRGLKPMRAFLRATCSPPLFLMNWWSTMAADPAHSASRSKTAAQFCRAAMPAKPSGFRKVQANL